MTARKAPTLFDQYMRTSSMTSDVGLLFRRHHDVRGHWAQTRRMTSDCTHVWDAEDADHYRCPRCGAHRWWRRAHQRGDISLGSVSKDYEVTE